MTTSRATKHKPKAVWSLGYSRNVCSECLMGWPCPDIVEVREAERAAELAEAEAEEARWGDA